MAAASELAAAAIACREPPRPQVSVRATEHRFSSFSVSYGTQTLGEWKKRTKLQLVATGIGPWPSKRRKFAAEAKFGAAQQQ
jgi:hypothetical protein